MTADQPDTPIYGLLYITERPVNPETIPQADSRRFDQLNGLDPGSAPPPSFTFGPGAADPYGWGAVAGQAGAIDIAALNPAISQPNPNLGCEGYHTAAPSLSFELALPLPYLRIFFLADTPGADAVLVVRMPDGAWYCGDDSFGTLNPTINVLGNPTSGIVQVWIGSWAPGGTIPGILYLTRGAADPLDPNRPPPITGLSRFGSRPNVIPTPTPKTAPTALPTIPPTGAMVAEPTATPVALVIGGATTYGAISLAPGFDPPAHGAIMAGGGPIDAAALGPECARFIAAQPDYRLDWAGGSDPSDLLRLFFVAEAGADTALLIFTPGGAWRCSDDAHGTIHPSVDLMGAAGGAYYVWVGAPAADAPAPGTLYITADAALTPASVE
ncbi:MAG: hypothetical protein GYB67_19625 [Chloroflexi bacterium]|nr:hypothetical protein [Chloroflexota bacterium]